MNAIKLTTIKEEACYIIKSSIVFLLADIKNNSTIVCLLSGAQIAVNESVETILGLDQL